MRVGAQTHLNTETRYCRHRHVALQSCPESHGLLLLVPGVTAASLFLVCHCAVCVHREATRELYAPFESNMRYSSTDVYQHEMPGGQYTNLKFQAASLGLGDSWNKVQSSYAAANR